MKVGQSFIVITYLRHDGEVRTACFPSCDPFEALCFFISQGKTTAKRVLAVQNAVCVGAPE